MLAPVLVEDREHHAALDLAQHLHTDLLFLGFVASKCFVGHELTQLIDVERGVERRTVEL